jgi:phosphohistidine phosphatase SixA
MSFRKVLGTLLLCAAAFAADASRTVIVVRHAERAAGMGADVELSKAGQLRAKRLAAMLADSKITAIYTSEVKRTQQTAAPLAKRLGIEPEAIPAANVSALVEKLRAGTGAALVVGHSNTVPEILKALGAGAVPPINDAEYTRLYVVTLSGAQATAVLLRY